MEASPQTGPANLLTCQPLEEEGNMIRLARRGFVASVAALSTVSLGRLRLVALVAAVAPRLFSAMLGRQRTGRSCSTGKTRSVTVWPTSSTFSGRATTGA